MTAKYWEYMQVSRKCDVSTATLGSESEETASSVRARQ